MKLLFFLLFTLAIVETTKSQEIGVIEGITPQDLQIGDGFSYDNLSSNPRLFNESVKTTSIPRSGFSLTFRYIGNRSSLRKTFTLNAVINYKSIGTSFENSFGFNTDEIIDNNNITICLIGTSVDSIRLLPRRVQKSDIDQDVLGVYDSNPYSFYKDYGDNYIKSIKYGSKICVFLTIKNSSNSQFRQLGNNADIKYGALNANLSLKDEYQSKAASNDISIQVSALGFSTNNLDFSKLLNYKNSMDIDSFFNATLSDLVSTKVTEQKNPVPISFEIAPLKLIMPKIPPAKINVDEIKMRDYLDAYYQYDLDKQNITTLKKNSTLLDLDVSETNQLNSLYGKLTDEIAKVAVINNKCFESKTACPTYVKKEIALENPTYYNNVYKIIPLHIAPYVKGVPTTPQTPLFNDVWTIRPSILKLIKGKEIMFELEGDIKSAEQTLTNPYFQTTLSVTGLKDTANDFQVAGAVKHFYVLKPVKVPDDGIIRISLMNFNSWDGTTERHLLRLMPYNFHLYYFLKETPNSIFLQNKEQLTGK